ncbi:FtsX-like permease family protein [Paenibacillus radicis (ex Gao et al. 2016)]|uniref:ABC transporter permease n=1 Tax=Paenibacillus radicis (ex Gao et al. 2016) TaxID=1737354 RepID=A0A917GWP3_9BACL|nr:ABC transporter permease [Paenibacillus radicis (ex Gao et al. 2016)]GGG59788.1 ABC transporter permease [Paenibacillus radicis (ex Gao et al. 2016)]
MLLKIVKRDFQRNKMITLGLFIFIMLSSLLTASSAHVVMELTHSLDNLLVKSNAPHFVQMHAGPIDNEAIANFAAANSIVKEQQTVEMLSLDGSQVTLGSSMKTEANSVMDIGFVKQNLQFDFLLNLDNEIIQVSEGEIAVPIYYMKQKNLHVGDQVSLSKGQFQTSFTIVDFVRDVQMNPSIVSSKRFVVSDADFTALKSEFREIEYLIEFQLTDLSKLSEFHNAYQASNLPNKGPAIDLPLLKTLNSLTDGVIAVVILLVSLLLILIAILCLRFTMLATIEEDYREIGVMKAIGIAQPDIKKIYLAKYFVLAILAAIGGYLLSLIAMKWFTANISLYLGAAPNSVLQHAVPLLAVSLIVGIVVLFCRLVLRRFNRITAVDALRTGASPAPPSSTSILSLSKRRLLPVNVFLGLKDVYGRFKMFGILLFVILVGLLIIIVPVNFMHTLQSPQFISYMGVGQSDIRIDLQQTANVDQRFEKMIASLEEDNDVVKLSPLVTSRFKVLGSDGAWESINVESGDFSIFPLSYMDGASPATAGEIALSDLNAKDLNKQVGDTVQLLIGDKEQNLTVSGIYQDITNGGRTAKARLPYNEESVLWYVVALDVKPGVSVRDKMDQYAEAFYPAKITHLEDYLAQTLGNTIKQLKLVVLLAIVISIAIIALITSLFLKMLLAKDAAQLTVMRSIGFKNSDIRIQYLGRILLVSAIGILIGILTTGTIGQGLVKALGSFMGASNIQLVVQPVTAYLIIPAAVMTIVAITTFVTTLSMNKSRIAEQIGK